MGNNNNDRSNNKKHKGKFNREPEIINNEIEITNKPNENFFDFSNNQDIFTKLKNTTVEDLTEEKNKMQKKVKEENDKKHKSWAYDNYIEEETHSQKIKDKKQTELQENLQKQREAKEQEKMEI